MNQFSLAGREYIELHNLLKLMGWCDSGGIAKMLIADGLVKVDGVIERRKRYKVRTGQVAEFQGQSIEVIA